MLFLCEFGEADPPPPPAQYKDVPDILVWYPSPPLPPLPAWSSSPPLPVLPFAPAPPPPPHAARFITGAQLPPNAGVLVRPRPKRENPAVLTPEVAL